MPLGYGTSATLTSNDITGARQFSRLRGAVLIGVESKGDIAAASPSASVNPPHIMNVSTQRSNLEFNATQTLASSTATSVFGWTPVIISTYSMTSSSGTSSGPAPTFIGANLAAMVYDTITSRLCIYSTVAGEWRSIAVSSS